MDILAQAIAIFVAFFISLVPSVGSTLEFVKEAVVPQEEARVVFGGDMMFDRSIRTAARERGDDFLFACLDPVLKNADLVVANLEGPITNNSSTSEGSTVSTPENFTFTFPPSTAVLLARHNVKLVNLGNNHIMNFSRDGLLQTLRYLDEAGVGHFGDPDKPEADRVKRMDIKGTPFSFVNWSDWTSDKTDHTVAQVRAEAEAGRVVVVYTHWGEEYVPATERMKRLARSFVDAGAAIVIGSHPHIVQEHEIYPPAGGGKHIYYSLGNMIFDQYFTEAVSHGLMLEVLFDRDGVAEIREIPIELKRDRQTCPVR